MEPEVVPAILVKTRADLIRRIAQVRGLVKEIQIDVMDGKFVPNTTIGIADLKDLTEASYEFHWMVRNPENWISQMPGPHRHLVHIETVKSIEVVEKAVKAAGGTLGLAINPETTLDLAIRLVPKAERVLIMTVHPGFSGQSYIRDMCGKMRRLRKLYPKLDIEVDGGINNETAAHAYSCGANILAAASAIFAAKNTKSAIAGLITNAKRGAGGIGVAGTRRTSAGGVGGVVGARRTSAGGVRAGSGASTTSARRGAGDVGSVGGVVGARRTSAGGIVGAKCTGVVDAPVVGGNARCASDDDVGGVHE